MKRFFQNKRNRITVFVIGGLLLLGLANKLIYPDGRGYTEEEVRAMEAPPKKLDHTKVYAIAKMFAKEHLGSADYGWGDDGITEWGDNNFTVKGKADIPGKRIHWAVELQFNGGEWDNISNWSEKNWSIR